MEFQVKHIEEIKLNGWTSKFDGIDMADFDTMKEISRRKSEHFRNLAQTEAFASKIKASKDGFGYAIGQNQADGFYYFAGVNSAVDAPDHFTIAESDYIVVTAKGGPSRELFDQLAALIFGKILPENKDKFAWEDVYLVEVLKNNNPMNAEVEVWFPIIL